MAERKLTLGDIKNIITEELTESNSKIKFSYAACGQTSSCLILHFESEEYISPSSTILLQQSMRDAIGCGCPVLVIVHQPEELLTEERLAQTIKEFIYEHDRTLEPHIRNCKITRDNGIVNMEFDRQMAPLLIDKLGLIGRIRNYIKVTYSANITFGEMKYTETDRSRELKEEYFKPEYSLQMLPKKKQAEATIETLKPEEKSDVIFGRNFTGDIMRMIEVAPDTNCIVEGEIITSEVKLTSENKYTIITFALTDQTSTMKAKIMLRGDQSSKASDYKTGSYVRLQGKLEFDTFAKENIIRVKNVIKAKRIEREDTSEKKRVELHLHTNMSAQDGITSASDYFAKAAKFGMKAMAVTDHGVVQAYPEANTASEKYGVQLIYGMEAYMVDDGKKLYNSNTDRNFYGENSEYVVFDLETTGLDNVKCGITEIGAVRLIDGKIVDTFSSFVNPGMPIPAEIVKLTGITDEMVKDAPDTQTALKSFREYIGESACLVAHNADFDMGFIKEKGKAYGISFDDDVIDTLAISRAWLPNLGKYKLNILGDHYGVEFKHHRAVNDCEATAEILLKMWGEMAEQRDIHTLKDMNSLIDVEGIVKGSRNVYHTVILVKNQKGLVNLYKLISEAHLKYFYRRPRIPKSLISSLREGLIIGSACEAGEVYRAALEGKTDEELDRIASFYDYLEIQPDGNNEFLIRSNRVESKEALHDINRRIIACGDRQGKMTVATCDCHFLNPGDEQFRKIVMDSIGFKDSDDQSPLYFRTTNEMLAEFAYLGDRAEEIVIDNTIKIAEMMEPIQLFPKETAMPYIEGAGEYIRERGYRRMKERYGDPLPEFIEQRMEKEFGSIIGHGFSMLYYIAQKLVENSNDHGYLVGSRGSVGSSIAAYAIGVTEVNPLPPHYVCPECKYSDFDIDLTKYGCGLDLPPKKCPHCGAELERDGFDIPFEVFLGLDADKVPDIDLNFSGDYQPFAFKYVEEFFGTGYVYRAGTISAVQDNTAFGMVKKYAEKRGLEYSKAEIERLASGITGTKRTTGRHPGGLVIVPKDREIYEFTPIQHPADDTNADSITTHFDFNSMHDVLIKLDILGHDTPTSIRMLKDLTGVDPMTVPVNDPATLSLFTSPDALGVTSSQLRGVETGTLGIPEFGTRFARQMLIETQPQTVADLLRISGLSHGTDVWSGNAQELIKSGTCVLKDCICTRDDIMNHLVQMGVDKKMAFFTMESVRKGKWAKGTEKNQAAQEAAMREKGVEDWFIDSCKKIKYMFPKAHAAAYDLISLRIAYFKVHYPAEYYATHFTIHADEFDASMVMNGSDGILRVMQAIEAKGKQATAKEAVTAQILECAYEMYARGYYFLPVDLKKSQAKKFGVEGKGVRLPFISVPQLGEKAAIQLYDCIQKGEIYSIEDLRKVAKISSSVIESLKNMGCLEGMPESAQLNIFEEFAMF